MSSFLCGTLSKVVGKVVAHSLGMAGCEGSSVMGPHLLQNGGMRKSIRHRNELPNFRSMWTGKDTG